MTRDALPPLLRGVGTTIVLAATVIAFLIARQQVHRQQTVREASRAAHKGEVNLQSLASEIHDLREEVDEDDVVEEVLENRWFECLGFIGTAVIATSFYAEWQFRRFQKDR